MALGFPSDYALILHLAHLWLRHIVAVLFPSTILGLIGVGEVAGMDYRVRDAHIVHRRLLTRNMQINERDAFDEALSILQKWRATRTHSQKFMC